MVFDISQNMLTSSIAILMSNLYTLRNHLTTFKEVHSDSKILKLVQKTAYVVLNILLTKKSYFLYKCILNCWSLTNDLANLY